MASVEDIDKGMKLGCSHPMGPLTLPISPGSTPPTTSPRSCSRSSARPDYAPPPLLKRMVLPGHLGRKSGAGVLRVLIGGQLIRLVCWRASWARIRTCDGLGEDPGREGLLRTPKVAQAWQYLTSGYRVDVGELVNGALFAREYSEIVAVKNIQFFSLCEHHLLPFSASATSATFPNGRVIGLTKIPRIVDMFARRLQVQERLTQQIAEDAQRRARGRAAWPSSWRPPPVHDDARRGEAAPSPSTARCSVVSTRTPGRVTQFFKSFRHRMHGPGVGEFLPAPTPVED